MDLITILIAVAAGGSPQPFWYSMGPIAFVMLIFYFLLIRPQQKQQKEHQNLISNVKKGDKMITNGGIWGEIDAVDQTTVLLKIGDKTKIVVSRSHLAGPQPKASEVEAKK